MRRMKRNISSGLMILVQVQKEAALLMQKMPSQRVTCSLRILFPAPHFQEPGIRPGTGTSQETPSTVSQDTIRSPQPIKPHHPVRITSLGLTP